MKNNKFLIIISSLFAIAAFLLSFKILPQYVNDGPCESEITIEILAEKDELSKGYEMLLAKNASIDGISTPMNATKIEGYFNTENGYFWGNGPAKITFSFPAAKDIDLLFNKHKWSGTILVYDGDEVSKINLFSDDTDNYLEIYTVKSNHLAPRYFLIAIISLLIAAAIGACVWFLLFTTFSQASAKKYSLALFLSTTTIWLFYLCANFPGTITIDTLNQFRQALGITEITDAHPAFLTLIYRLIFKISGGPGLFTLIQIALYALTLTSFLSYLCKLGLSRKIASLAAVLFSAHIVNGIYATVLWKDVLYTVALLWATLLLLKLSIEKKAFFSAANIIQLSLSSAFVFLLRHNGMIVFGMILATMAIAVLALRSIKPLAVILATLTIVGVVKGPLYSSLGIENQAISAPNSLLHGIVYTCMESDFESELLESVVPMEVWYEVYEPYSTNSFVLSNASIQNNLVEKMNALSSSDVIKEYLRAFINHPFLIIKDRLYGCNSLWNTITSGYNWRTGNNQYKIVVETNELGFYCRENAITDFISNLYQKSISNRFYDSLIWRVGPYLSIAFVLLFITIIQRKWAFLLAYIPIVGNSISLILSMAWQDYRYVYFVFVLSVFLALSYAVYPSKNTRKEIDGNTTASPDLSEEQGSKPDKKHICLVSSQYLPHVGGVENYVYNLSRELASRGHSVTIVTSLIEGTSEYEKNENIEIYRLPSLQLMNGRFPVLKMSKARKKLEKDFKNRHFDMMLVNMRFFFISLWAVKLAKKLGIKCAIIDHGSSHLNTGGKLTSKLGELFEHWITWREKHYCKNFAGVSKESLNWLKHFKINSDILLNNAVDLETFEKYKASPVRNFREEYGIPGDATVISFVGRLTVEKGIEQLVNSVKRINDIRKDVYLLAAGGGYLKEKLEDTKSENTHLVGQISTPEVASLLSASDIFCLPSFSEGFPTCVIEACVAHNYIITTYRGDAKEIIKDSERGIILPNNNEDGVYNAIMSVLDAPEKRKIATDLCYRTVINNYTWKHTCDSFLKLIEKIQ